MTTTNAFKEVIFEHLTSKASKEPDFKERMNLEGKSIDNCVNYILEQVKKSKRNGFADQEVFDMAYFYYESDTLKKIKDSSGQVVVNHTTTDTSKKLDPWRVTQDEKKYILDLIKLNKGSAVVDEFRKDLRTLDEKPYSYWNGIVINSNDLFNTEEVERKEIVDFMVKHHKPKSSATKKDKTPPKKTPSKRTTANKKKTTRKATNKIKVVREPIIEKSGQTALF